MDNQITGKINCNNSPEDVGLEEVKQSFLLLMHHADEPIILVNRNLQIIAFTKNFQSQYLLYFGKEIVTGSSVLDFAVTTNKSELIKTYEQVFAGEAGERELMFLFDEAPHYFVNKFTPVSGKNGNIVAVMVASANITSKRQMEQKIAASEKRFRAIIEKSHDGISLLGADGRTSNVSPSVEKILGYSTQEWLNLNPAELSHPQDTEKVFEVLKSIQEQPGHSATLTYRMLHKDGSWCWLKSNITNLLHDEDIKSIVFNYEDITELVEAERQKENYQNERNALINSTDDWIWSVNNSFKFITFNKAFAGVLYAFTKQNVQPGDDALLHIHLPEPYLAYWKNAYTSVLEGSNIKDELQLPQAENEPKRWVEISLNPIVNNNKITGIACYARDITENKMQQTELQEINSKLAQAQSIAKIGYWESNLATGGLFWSEEIYSIFGVAFGTVLNSDHFYKAIHPEDVREFMEARKVAIQNRAQEAISFRIIRKDKTIRHVLVRIQTTTNNRQELIKLGGTLQDVTENHLIEEKLLRSERSLRQAQKIAKIGSWEIDFGQAYDIWSDELYNIFGVEKDEIEPSFYSFQSFIHPEDLTRVLDAINESEKKLQNHSILFRIIKKDGTLRTLFGEWRFTFIQEQTLTGIYGIIHDVTEQKAIEAENTKLLNILQRSLNEVYMYDSETLKCEYANDGAIKNLGYNLNELVDKTANEIKVGFSEDAFRTLVKPLENNDKKIVFESFHLRADGSFYPVEGHLQLVKHLNKSVYLCVVLDITDRKIAEEKLKESEINLRTIFDNTSDGFILLDKHGYIKAFNKKAKTLTFLNVDGEVNIGVNIFNYVQEERKVAFAQIFQKVMNGETYAYNHSFKKAGGIIWIHFILKPLYEGTEFTGISITGRDITKKILAEEKLHQSEKRFRELIENSEDAIMLFNENGYITYQSPSTERIYGFSLADIQTSPILEIIHPSDRENMRLLITQAYNNSGVPQFSTHRILHKNGSGIWTEGTVTNHLTNENIQAYVVNFRDISQHINYLKDIEEQNAIFREIVWMQSHTVRAPLARIMGLTHLLSSMELDDIDRSTALQHISTASHELDNVIKQIIKKAEEIEYIASKVL